MVFLQFWLLEARFLSRWFPLRLKLRPSLGVYSAARRHKNSLLPLDYHLNAGISSFRSNGKCGRVFQSGAVLSSLLLRLRIIFGGCNRLSSVFHNGLGSSPGFKSLT